ncbi:MAG: hypothetical protein AUK44_05310 [Porphyromonadaceae bacterium CG2_30_38_12]|nr:MAG: hypothetical protein AUK44_05310 [Porphyromonadaceae bacterium CG2_30_38_12]
MKRTVTINLNNIVFHIDDDAYDMLQSYLREVEKHLSEEERKEVMADIEARIAEIFSESLKRNKSVINVEDVTEIIAVLGKPSEYADEDTADNQTQEPPTNSEKSRSRRFYRDSENAFFGGVAAGLAAYLSWDVTWVRIALVALVFVGAGTVIPIYLVMWLIAPKATTAAQRLEMQGEDVTVENIKSEINNVKNYVNSDKFKQSSSSFGEKLLDVFRVLVKVVVGFVGIILGFVGIVIALVLIFVLISLFFLPGFLTGFSPEMADTWSSMQGDNGAILIISLLLVIGTPVFLIIYWAINLLSRKKFEYAKTTSIVSLILWLAGIFMLFSVSEQSFKNLKTSGQLWNINLDETDEPSVDEVRKVDSFTAIDVADNIEVELTQDSTKQLMVSAPQPILSKIKTEVVDGTLKIYSDQFMLNYPIKVTVSTDSIFELNCSGASKINTTDTFRGSRLRIKLSGASQMDADFAVTGNSEFDLSGASSLTLEGSSQAVTVGASGASKFDGDNFRTRDAQLDASGAAQIRVFADRSLNAKASGGSQIECEGSPKNVKKTEMMGSSIDVQ